MAARALDHDPATRVAICSDWAVYGDGLAALLSQMQARCVGYPLEAEPDEVRVRVAAAMPHVVLMLEVPGTDGETLAARVGACALVAPVVVVGAFPDRATVTRMLDAGARGCVAGAGTTTGRIVEAVTRVRAGRGYLCPTTTHRFVQPGVAESVPARPRLTQRETEVLRLLARGSTSADIARRFGLSIRTIHTHRAHILRKLGVRTTAALVRAASRAGLLVPGDDAEG